MRLAAILFSVILFSIGVTASAGQPTYQEGTSIGHIVVRHSPALQKLAAEYAICGQKRWKDCDFNSMWDRKNAVITTDWPRVFDYLVSLKSWGAHIEAKEEFLYALERYGAENLRNRCTPVIVFWRRKSEYLYHPIFRDF